MRFVSLVAFYVDPGSGSMILQLLLGGVGGVYVIFRLFKQRIRRMLGIQTETELPAGSPPTESVAKKGEDD